MMTTAMANPPENHTLRRNSIVPVPKRRKRATSLSHPSKRHDVVVDMGLFQGTGKQGKGMEGASIANMLETLRDTEGVWTMNVGRVRTLSSRTSWTSIKQKKAWAASMKAAATMKLHLRPVQIQPSWKWYPIKSSVCQSYNYSSVMKCISAVNEACNNKAVIDGRRKHHNVCCQATLAGNGDKLAPICTNTSWRDQLTLHYSGGSEFSAGITIDMILCESACGYHFQLHDFNRFRTATQANFDQSCLSNVEMSANAHEQCLCISFIPASGNNDTTSNH